MKDANIPHQETPGEEKRGGVRTNKFRNEGLDQTVPKKNTKTWIVVVVVAKGAVVVIAVGRREARSGVEARGRHGGRSHTRHRGHQCCSPRALCSQRRATQRPGGGIQVGERAGRSVVLTGTQSNGGGGLGVGDSSLSCAFLRGCIPTPPPPWQRVRATALPQRCRVNRRTRGPLGPSSEPTRRCAPRAVIRLPRL